MAPSATEPGAGTGGRPSSPSRHLLKLIVDALFVPAAGSAPEDEAAYLAPANQRSGVVQPARRQALAGPGDGSTLPAARRPFDTVPGMLAAGYRPAAVSP